MYESKSFEQLYEELTGKRLSNMATETKLEDWLSKAEEDFGGDFVNMKDGKCHRVTFTGAPEREMFRPAGEDKDIVSWNFPVLESGKESALSVTSRRLYKLVKTAYEDGLLIGFTYDITPVGEGMGKQWTMVIVKEP
jgi:hypothetical protein